MMCKILFAVSVVVLLFALPANIHAQGGRGGQIPAPPTARAGAPIDITGYWVSLVTDDWVYRMVTPAKGDVQHIPLNAEGIRVANAWDPAKDEAEGNPCKAYAAPAIMRLPGRLRITWENDNTLRIDTDTGQQTRRFNFTPQTKGEPTWQGYSLAQWEFAGGPRGGRRAAAPVALPRAGQLKVVTTNLRPGYLRKNGVPYSANVVLTEYFSLLKEDDGNQYLAVTTMVDDPQYLGQLFVKTMQFKKLPDASSWDPTPCSAR